MATCTREVSSVQDRTYASNRQTPAVARGFVHAQLLIWGLPELSDTAELVVSELVSNAYMHARGNIIGVRLECSGGAVMIRVMDENPHAVPTVPSSHGDDLEAFGRGLTLVAACSESWGWYRTADGHKVLYALITRPM